MNRYMLFALLFTLILIAPEAIHAQQGRQLTSPTTARQQQLQNNAAAELTSYHPGKKITFAQFAEEFKLEAADITYLKDKLGVQSLHAKVCHNVNTTYCRVLNIGNRSCAQFEQSMKRSPQFKNWHLVECFTAGNGQTYVTVQLAIAMDNRTLNSQNY